MATQNFKAELLRLHFCQSETCSGIFSEELWTFLLKFMHHCHLGVYSRYRKNHVWHTGWPN